MKVTLQPAAREDLRDIWFFGARRWSPEQADRYSDAIDAAIESLADNPLRVALAGRPKGFRRLLVRSHAIWFRIDADEVVVVRVLHQSRDAGRWLGRR